MIRMVLHPDFEPLRDFVEHLCTGFHVSGQVLYRGRNELRIFETQSGPVVVKRFRTPHIINRIAYTFLRPSKARRSYEYARVLLHRGISTPHPVGYLEEYAGGVLARSFYVSRYASEARSLRPYLDGTQTDPDILRELAVFIAEMHAQGVLHLDLSPGNILMESLPSGVQFSLVDINRMRFARDIPFGAACANFQALACSSEASALLAECYAACRGWDPVEVRSAIDAASDRFFGGKAGRFARKAVRREKGWLCSVLGPVQGYYLCRTARKVMHLAALRGALAIRCRELETALYYRWMLPGDLRRVLERRNGYRRSP